MLLALGLFLTLLMGLSLGLLGGGGSILTVPILHYVLGQPPHEAISFSLVLVGSTALLASLLHHREKQVDWRTALVFAAFGAPASYLLASLSSRVDGRLLFFLFSLLLFVAGVSMLRPRRESIAPAQKNWPLVAGTGAALGGLTGFLGVGGGFLIVPALVFLLGLPIKRAIGTSLVIIAFNSAVGVAGHRIHLHMDLTLLAQLSAAALLGTLFGARLAARLDAVQLRLAFGVFILALGVFMFVRNLPF